jgi:hypothetical protein
MIKDSQKKLNRYSIGMFLSNFFSITVTLMPQLHPEETAGKKNPYMLNT